MQEYGIPIDRFETHSIHTNVAFSLGKYSWSKDVNYRECFTLEDARRRANNCLFRSILMNGNPGCYISQTELRHSGYNEWKWHMSNTKGNIVEIEDDALTYIVLKFFIYEYSIKRKIMNIGYLEMVPKDIKNIIIGYMEPDENLLSERQKTFDTFIAETQFCPQISGIDDSDDGASYRILLYGIFCDDDEFVENDGRYYKQFTIGHDTYYIDFYLGMDLLVGRNNVELASYDYSMRAALGSYIMQK